MLSILVTGGLLLTAEPSSILNVYISHKVSTKCHLVPQKFWSIPHLKWQFVLVLHLVDIPLKVFSTNHPHIYSAQSVKSM